MTQVFLSHSSEDAEFALKLATDLRAAGVPIWKAPESILDGEEWVAAIERGITTSTHMLLLKSPAAVRSKWVRFEFNAALSLEKQGKMRIIPIDYLPCNPPLFWTQFQHVSGIQDAYHATLFNILARLREEQPAHPPTPTNAATTINVVVQGDVTGQLNVAGNDIIYAGQPSELPSAPQVIQPELPTATPNQEIKPRAESTLADVREQAEEIQQRTSEMVEDARQRITEAVEQGVETARKTREQLDSGADSSGSEDATV
jgi:hypothetical protein